MIIKVGKLRDADMREILRPQAEEAPEVEVDGLQGIFMCEILILVVEFEEILVGECCRTMALGYGERIEQSCLSHEERLYLKDTVAVVRHIIEWNAERPLFHRLCIDSEAIVACHGHEISRLP